eukprot:UC4_evm4s127
MRISSTLSPILFYNIVATIINIPLISFALKCQCNEGQKIMQPCNISTSANAICEDCSPGKYGVNGIICENCTPRENEMSGGTYQDKSGQSSCKECKTCDDHATEDTIIIDQCNGVNDRFCVHRTPLPSNEPTNKPTGFPSGSPTHDPSTAPSLYPTTISPTESPTTLTPTSSPTIKVCEDVNEDGTFESDCAELDLSFQRPKATLDDISREIKTHQNLRILRLAGLYDKFNDKGVSALADALQHNHNLEYVALSHNPISMNHVKKLQRAVELNKNCNIDIIYLGGQGSKEMRSAVEDLEESRHNNCK